MSMKNIIDTLDAEIEALQKARAILAGEPGGKNKRNGAVNAPKKKRKISPEGRARIQAAVKRRWANAKKAAKAAA